MFSYFTDTAAVIWLVVLTSVYVTVYQCFKLWIYFTKDNM